MFQELRLPNLPTSLWKPLTGVATILIILVQMYTLSQSPQLTAPVAWIPNDQPLTTTAPKRNEGPSIKQWIWRSYNETYAVLDQCPENVGFKACLRTSYEQLSSDLRPSDSLVFQKNLSSTPWWFRTVLRDASDGRGLHGSWHDLEFTSTVPPTRMCTIEKVGTTQWRRVECLLNRSPFKPFKGQPCKVPLPDDGSKIVFLRDPLERFLSGYIDKCIKKKDQGHCEPADILHNKEGVDRDRRAMFEMYVDTMALKWNMHFFPSSFYCGGLYRTLGSYDFVGTMDRNFYHDLGALGDKFGDNMTKALEQVFDVSHQTRMNTSNVGKETRAPDLVRDYYSGRSIRRVLQYLSIDYVKLNLPVPGWAREMFDQENIRLAMVYN